MLNSPIAFWLLLLVGVLILAYTLFQPRIKGKIGEKKIALLLSLLNSSNYKVLNDVVLETNGKTSQIDHIVISDYGIFVIETKNYKGWILGGEHSEYWTQVLFRRREKLYNPIRQNHSHILALKKCLREFPNAKYVSVIVFSSEATIKVKTETKVTYPFRLVRFIERHSEVYLSQDEKERIYEKINSLNRVDHYDRRQHIEAIKQKTRIREESLKQSKCPRCGHELVERNGKYGNFIGCSNFPRCKFTTKTY